MYLFPGTAVTKNHQPDGLKQQKFAVSQFKRLEIHNQGVSRAMIPLKPVGEYPSLTPASGGGHGS